VGTFWDTVYILSCFLAVFSFMPLYFYLTMLQYYTCMQCTQNNTYTKMNLRTVKWAQWDKTQSRELLGLFICVCIALCTIVAQNRPDNFPSYPPDNHHCSDDVYLREGGQRITMAIPCCTTAHRVVKLHLQIKTTFFSKYPKTVLTRMWANAQPDGRPAEHRWRPLSNATKFGWRPLLDAVQ